MSHFAASCFWAFCASHQRPGLSSVLWCIRCTYKYCT